MPRAAGIREVGTDGFYWRRDDDSWWSDEVEDRAAWCARFTRFYWSDGDWREYAERPLAGQLTDGGDNCEAPRDGPE